MKLFVSGYFLLVNTLPNNKILDLSKLKAVADDKIIVTQNLQFVLLREENMVGGKRGECWLPAFSPFPTKLSILGSLKEELCGKGLKEYQDSDGFKIDDLLQFMF